MATCAPTVQGKERPLNERYVSGIVPADQAEAIAFDRWSGATLGDIIALIRGWQAPVLSAPEPLVFGPARDEPSRLVSPPLPVVAISVLFLSS